MPLQSYLLSLLLNTADTSNALKCWQSVASDCARNCNYNAGRGQSASVRVRMCQLNHNALELKYCKVHMITCIHPSYNVYKYYLALLDVLLIIKGGMSRSTCPRESLIFGPRNYCLLTTTC